MDKSRWLNPLSPLANSRELCRLGRTLSSAIPYRRAPRGVHSETSSVLSPSFEPLVESTPSTRREPCRRGGTLSSSIPFPSRPRRDYSEPSSTFIPFHRVLVETSPSLCGGIPFLSMVRLIVSDISETDCELQGELYLAMFQRLYSPTTRY